MLTSNEEKQPLLEKKGPRQVLPGTNHIDVQSSTPLTRIVRAPHELMHWVEMLRDQFGHRLLLFIVASEFGILGVTNHFAGQSRKWVYRMYNLPAPRMQVYEGIVHTAWAAKPIIGVVSDLCPIAGYNKAPYIVMMTIVALCGLGTIGFGNSAAVSIQITVVCLFLIKIQTAGVEVLAKAKYSEQLSQKPECGADLLTFTWSIRNCADVVTGVACAWIIGTYGARIPFVVALIPAGLILWPVLNNYMCESPQSENEVQRVRSMLLGQCGCCFLCIVMFAAILGLIGLGLFSSSKQTHAVGAIVMVLIVLITCSVALRPSIAKINAFFLIQSFLTMSIDGAAFYFYTDTPLQYKTGPHFSVMFYTTLPCIGSMFSLAGLLIYNKYMKEYTYQSLLLTSNLLLSALALMDCVQFSRYNLHLGIPDRCFLIGSELSKDMISQWQTMPGILLMSQVSPKGMEATMFALLSGCCSLGASAANYLGAYFLEALHVLPAGLDDEDEHFGKLWIAALVASLLPMLTLCLIPVLIPNARQTERLIGEDDRSVTEGSIWSRWFRVDGDSQF